MARLGMRTPCNRVRYRFRYLHLVAAFSVLIAGGCWRPAPAPPAPPPMPVADTSDLAQKKIEVPEIKEIAKPKEKPAPKAEPPEEAVESDAASAAPAKPTNDAPMITPEQLAAISVGMSLEDVRKAMGVEAQTISASDVSSAILKWTDDTGRSLLAKFENGELVRKSIFDPEGGPAVAAEQNGPKITQDLYDGITAGMSVEEVKSLLGLNGRRIAEGQDNIVIYKWVDDSGSNFTAKFENGALVHKTGFYVSQLAVNDTAPAQEMEASAPEPEPETVFEPEPPPEAEDSGMPSVEPPAAETPATVPENRPQVTSTKPQRVRVAGTSRREREAATRDPDQPTGSYKPKAKLPGYTWNLRRGSYEVRIHNSTGSRARVGLRTGQGGKDIAVSAGGTQSFRVDRANYDLYYVFDDSPYKLHRSSGIVLDGFYYGDIEITLFDEDSEIRGIDYAFE